MVLGPTQVQLQQSCFPGDEECDRRTSWAQNKMQRTDRAFKALLLLPWAAFLIIRSKFSFFLWFMFSCHELPPPSPLQPLRGFATAENNRNAAAQVTFPSPSSKTLPTGKTQPGLLLLHHLGNLLKYTITKVEGGGNLEVSLQSRHPCPSLK